ncbi:Cro/CI family transcriptional regulator [Pseudomonas sp. AN-1]|uniref:Cro/CI family transcriptional regulator n=1 Tax=Pseudomonas sp. AN-1 TaxID=3096605 RepID=UPI002A6B298D|nr:Cro/CI family transcriptional regulator [Pseudomonas sp. AN-1]WPP47725.1 Cro/CI family transcriptional regulator [Pseudomonas sp. AN-1]
MEKISLPEFVRRVGQAEAARILGLKPPSIAKAIKAKRNIIISVLKDGAYSAEEVRPFPSSNGKKAA